MEPAGLDALVCKVVDELDGDELIVRKLEQGRGEERCGWHLPDLFGAPDRHDDP